MHSFFRKLAQGLGPAVALVVMEFLGYVNNSIDPVTNQPCIDVTLLSFDVAVNLRVLVAVLFLVSAVMQFIGLALVYRYQRRRISFR